MAVYAIGDVHACLSSLHELLAAVRFHPERDRLWFVGDVVSRGPDFLPTLRFLYALGDRAVVVLGNHEGRLLAALSGHQDRYDDTQAQLLRAAPDALVLERWLRARPLVHLDRTLGFAMVHAGLLPGWRLEQARAWSDALSRVLRRPDMSRIFFQRHAEEEASQESSGQDDGGGGEMVALRAIFAVMTKIRLCTPDGQPVWPHHPQIAGQADPYAFDPAVLEGLPFRPWFERRPVDETIKIVYGHWAAAGFRRYGNTWGLDSGCVYGNGLTAVRLDHPDHPITQVSCPQQIAPKFGH